MRKKFFCICLGLAMAMAVAACGMGRQGRGAQEASDVQRVQGERRAQDEQDVQEAAGTQNTDAVREQVLAEMSDEQKNWMGGLSREQRLADFESLSSGLRENYPYVKLAKRQAGADLDALEESYRTKVEKCANDNEFYETVHEFVGAFSFTGHLELWGGGGAMRVSLRPGEHMSK